MLVVRSVKEVGFEKFGAGRGGTVDNRRSRRCAASSDNDTD
jgi:hypothetical protein